MGMTQSRLPIRRREGCWGVEDEGRRSRGGSGKPPRPMGPGGFGFPSSWPGSGFAPSGKPAPAAPEDCPAAPPPPLAPNKGGNSAPGEGWTPRRHRRPGYRRLLRFHCLTRARAPFLRLGRSPGHFQQRPSQVRVAAQDPGRFRTPWKCWRPGCRCRPGRPGLPGFRRLTQVQALFLRRGRPPDHFSQYPSHKVVQDLSPFVLSGRRKEKSPRPLLWVTETRRKARRRVARDTPGATSYNPGARDTGPRPVAADLQVCRCQNPADLRVCSHQPGSHPVAADLQVCRCQNPADLRVCSHQTGSHPVAADLQVCRCQNPADLRVCSHQTGSHPVAADLQVCRCQNPADLEVRRHGTGSRHSYLRCPIPHPGSADHRSVDQRPSSSARRAEQVRRPVFPLSSMADYWENFPR